MKKASDVSFEIFIYQSKSSISSTHNLRSRYFRQIRLLVPYACQGRFHENPVHRRKQKLVLLGKEAIDDDIVRNFPDVNFISYRIRTRIRGTGSEKLRRFPIDAYDSTGSVVGNPVSADLYTRDSIALNRSVSTEKPNVQFADLREISIRTYKSDLLKYLLKTSW